MTTTEGKKLSLFDSTTIIMGSMIGSGIFIVSAEIARKVETPGMLIMAWVITGVITILGALCYGELAAMFPKAGGQYVYLREAFGPAAGFLYGWSLFAVIQTGTIAAVAVAFAKFAGVFYPLISAQNILLDIGFLQINTQQLLAVGIIILLSVYNYRDIKAGALVQNIFTISKIIALIFLIVIGFYGASKSIGIGAWGIDAFPSVINLAVLGVFGAALTGSLFSADAWNNITYTAGEVKNPQRNLPLSLFIGTATVIVLYILANFAYLSVLSMDQIKVADNDRVGTLLMQTVLGANGKLFMAVMIMVSTFGCLNGVIFTAARVYYAMAKDGFFLKQAAVLNKNNVPANALTMQCIWACLLCFSGTYNNLLEYIMFVVMVFYVLTITGLFVLRFKRPDLARPYKALGYPVLPALYIILAFLVALVMMIYQTKSSLYGMFILVIGYVVYLIIPKKQST